MDERDINIVLIGAVGSLFSFLGFNFVLNTEKIQWILENKDELMFTFLLMALVCAAYPIMMFNDGQKEYKQIVVFVIFSVIAFWFIF